MKYFLFDLFVAAASLAMLTAALGPMLRNHGEDSPQSRRTTQPQRQLCDAAADAAANRTIGSGSSSNSIAMMDDREEQQDCDALPRAVVENETSSGPEESRRTTAPPEASSSSSSSSTPTRRQDHFKVGDTVEIYGPKSFYAMPATVIGLRRGYENDKTSPLVYDLQSAIVNARPTGVDPTFIYPYRPYDDGTTASCNVAPPPRGVYLTPCRIVSHLVKRRGGFISYRVEYLDYDYANVGRRKDDFPEYLPYSRVQRRII